MKSFNYGRLCIFLILLGCDRDRELNSKDFFSRAASEHTLVANASVADHELLMSDDDFINAKRGLIALAPNIGPLGYDGRPMCDPSDTIFAGIETPETVNPSLWRQARLNSFRGSFEVEDEIFQLRGFDLANMTLIKSENG